MTAFTESIVDQAALECLEGVGYTVLFGPDIAPSELRVADAERIVGRCV